MNTSTDANSPWVKNADATPRAGPAAGRKCWTPEGPACVVYAFPDGSLAVEFPHGGGAVYPPAQIFGLGPARRGTEDPSSN